MGTFEFRLPDIGEGVVEGEIVEWMVSVGDSVKEDDPILSVMTDKATVEIPSPVDGKVTSMKGEAGEILAVGQVCIEFEVEGDGNTEGVNPSPKVNQSLRLKLSKRLLLSQRRSHPLQALHLWFQHLPFLDSNH